MVILNVMLALDNEPIIPTGIYDNTIISKAIKINEVSFVGWII